MSEILSADYPLILVTGPARSGKSEWAECLADQMSQCSNSSLNLKADPSGATQRDQAVSNFVDCVIYMATSLENPADAEWQARIRKHQQRRPASWHTQAVPVHLAEAIAQSPSNACLLIDSLGTWLANLLEQDEQHWLDTVAELEQSLIHRQAPIILVAEETGWGVVPAYPLGRTFRDRLGILTRRIGAIATTVYLVTAGHVLNLSHLGTPMPAGVTTQADA